MTPPPARRLAIACQGGGSHTAFTAGALKRVLRARPALQARGWRLTALSGTSGGAICALLAWCGLLRDDWDDGVRRLDAFWADVAAVAWWDRLLNDWLVGTASLRDFVSLPELSPYLYPPWASDRLRALLQAHVDFAAIPKLVGRDSPALLVGAVSALSGRFKIFRGKRITAEAILASAAIPDLFRAVCIDNLPYWDGLFSQNPPVRDLVDNVDPPSNKPDEIWVIQINPLKRRGEPRRVGEILDRRNELAGNLSLQQEIYHIRKMNELIRRGVIADPKYKPVRVRILALDEDLTAESKLNRSPDFISRMMSRGEATAGRFLDIALGRTKEPADTHRLA